METPRTLKVRIHPDGKVELETDGFVGPSCADLTRKLATILAGSGAPDRAIEERLKPEYYVADATTYEENDIREER
jgi:hypothetical protein